MLQKSFGKLPAGSRLERIKKSKHYRDGKFQNLSETKMMASDTSYFSLARKLFGKGIDRMPEGILPAVKTNLKALTDEGPTIIWFGHSSYLIRIMGKNILVDPVFSKRASPIQSFGIKSFDSSVAYAVEDFPAIDLMIITHDHYDHLDYNSIVKFRPFVKAYCTALGVGEHLVYWGIEESSIKEFDWWEDNTVLPGIKLTATPARHFSGRAFTRNQTLWTSFVLKTNEHCLFLGGDSGYDETFKTIGTNFGPFDLAILECGQYNTMWPHIHMMPEETVQASLDLEARAFMPVHWGKFALALHPWKEPVERALRQAELLKVQMATPLMGEPLVLNGILPQTHWWE